LAQKKFEDYGIVLDFLPQGHPNDPRPLHLREPVVQLLGEDFFTLLEVIPKREARFEPQERVFIGKGERDKVERIRRRIGYEDLTSAAKAELPSAVRRLVEGHPERFLEFFNRAGPLTTRFHQLELIPGIGKKLMWSILEEREKAPFSSLEDLKSRVRGLGDLREMVAGRVVRELQGEDRYRIFVRPPSKKAEEEE
jgi:putative nucleotide binding protein